MSADNFFGKAIWDSIAERDETSPETLERLSHDGHRDVRYYVAGNVNALQKNSRQIE